MDEMKNLYFTDHEVGKALSNATFFYKEKYKNCKSYTGIGCPIWEPMDLISFMASELNKILQKKMQEGSNYDEHEEEKIDIVKAINGLH